MESVKNVKFVSSLRNQILNLWLHINWQENLMRQWHELDNNLHYTHFIDHFTRLSGAAKIRSKDPCIVLNKFLQHWVSLYSSPRKVLSDSGGDV